MVTNAFRARFGFGVIPRHAVGNGVEARVEFGAERGAHRHCRIGAVEPDALAPEAVDVRRLYILAAKAAQHVVRAVVSQYEQEVRPAPFVGRRPYRPRARRRGERRGKSVFHEFASLHSR